MNLNPLPSISKAQPLSLKVTAPQLFTVAPPPHSILLIMHLFFLVLTVILAATFQRQIAAHSLSRDIVLIDDTRVSVQEDIRAQGYEYAAFLNTLLAWNANEISVADTWNLKQCCWYVFKKPSSGDVLYLVGLIPNSAMSQMYSTKEEMLQLYPNSSVHMFIVY